MGSPCVGKTSVSKHLASKLNALHIDLGELVTRERLASGVDKKRGTLIADRARLSKRVQQIMRQNRQDRDVIIDGHYATDIVPARNITRVFVLRRHPEKLKKLMEKRGFKKQKIWENLAAEILDVCLYDAIKAAGLDKVCELDITGKQIGKTVDDIVSFLDEKKRCAVGSVDWLGKLEQEKRLDEFLKEF
jgi:broad-specificity NMP kinase